MQSSSVGGNQIKFPELTEPDSTWFIKISQITDEMSSGEAAVYSRNTLRLKSKYMRISFFLSSLLAGASFSLEDLIEKCISKLCCKLFSCIVCGLLATAEFKYRDQKPLVSHALLCPVTEFNNIKLKTQPRCTFSPLKLLPF